jgi:dipeptidyl aminopeptidase/acylaminoacyl peptidase
MKISTVARLCVAMLLCACIKATAEEAASAASGTQPTSIVDFVGPSEIRDIQYSPNGKYIAAIISLPENPHENAFAIFDGQTAAAIRLIHSGKRAAIYQYFWATDDRLVASLAVQHDLFDTPSRTGEIFAINADGSHQADLFGFRKKGGEETYATANVIDTKLVAPNEILIATNAFTRSEDGSYTQIQRLDINFGHAAYAGKSPAKNSVLLDDHAGQVRVAVATKDDVHHLLWTRANNDADWKLTNDPEKSGISIEPIGFNRDNSKLYVRVSQGKQPDTIELMDMTTYERTLVYKPQFASPSRMLRTADGMDYYAIFTRDGKSSLYFLDENSTEARLTKALQANFPGEVAFFSSFTRDGEHAIVEVMSDRDPGDYFVFDLKTKQAHHLISAKSRIDPEKMRPMEPVVVKSRDGLDLHGFLTLPAGKKPYPLIVLPHGGPHGISDDWGFNGEVQLFASHGYAVLQVNYRGSGGYGSWFQHIGYRQWGLSMQDDLTDATHWAIDQGYTTPQHICIYGGSYGGYAALEGAVREPDLYKCAIGYSGVYDLRVQLDHSDTSRSTAGNAYMKLALGDNRDDLLARSPLSGTARIKANILLLHGGDDERVPIKNLEELTSALDKNGTHYEQLIMPHEGHGFYLPAHKQEAYQKMLDFLDKNIGGNQSTTTASAP